LRERESTRIGRRVALAWVALTLAASASAAEPIPYRLAIEVAWGKEKGPKKITEEIERRVRERIVGTRCVREVLPSGEKETADLLLRMTIESVREETIYDQSMMATHTSPDPTDKLQYTAIFEADIRLDLLSMPGGELVRSTKFREGQSRRPQTDYEDPVEYCRERALVRIIDTMADKVCGANPKKLEKRIAKAKARAAASR
jgi:hypothetical protein